MRIEVHDRELWCQRLEKAERPYRDQLAKALADIAEHHAVVAAYKAKPWWKTFFSTGYGAAPEHDGLFYLADRHGRKNKATKNINHLVDLRLSITNAHPKDVPHLDQYDLSLMGDFVHWIPEQEELNAIPNRQ